VRAVGFVHSKLVKKKARVSSKLIDATDWLPTFYHLGGGDVSGIKDKVDGMNVWNTISQDTPSPRSEILHNIDPLRKFAAIRVNNFKLIVNQDAVYKQTWHPRYEEENGKQDDQSKPKTLPGAVVDCGRRNADEKTECNTSKFPCLFDIVKG
jgi:arylsulfatase A-like enzyme